MTFTLKRITQWMCGMIGHETVLLFEPNRLALRCIQCEYESPGWTLDSKSRRSNEAPRRCSSAAQRPALESIRQLRRVA
jgi:hypothetical protein